MPLTIPLTLLDTDPVQAAGMLIERDVKPMYELACSMMEQVGQANFRAPSSSRLSLRSSNAMGRMWFGSEQYLFNYTEALRNRLSAGGTPALVQHTVTVPECLREKTNKPPNWVMIPEIRRAQISRLMRYDDLVRLDARLEFLARQRETSPDSAARHNGGGFLSLMVRQRDSQRRQDRPSEPLIVYAISHYGFEMRRGNDYFQSTLRGMRNFVRSLDCYAQSPSAFFRRNGYAAITGMGYRDYYDLILKTGIYNVSDARYQLLMRERQNALRAQASASVSEFTDAVSATPRPERATRTNRTPWRVQATRPTGADEIDFASYEMRYMQERSSQNTFWIAPDDHQRGLQ